MLTKKDYELIADTMASTRMLTPTDSWVNMMLAYIKRFKLDNPRFDEERFKAACYAEHSIKVTPEPFIATTSYDLSLVLGVAKGQTAPSADEFERIILSALQDKLNVPTTPYYVASVTVTSRTSA